MTTLTDLQLCKRIAEIKGLAPKVVSGSVITTRGLLNFFDLSHTHMANKTTRYLFDLMFEFEVCICHYNGIAFIQSDNTDGDHKSVVSFDSDSQLSFRRAILLSIIEANNHD